MKKKLEKQLNSMFIPTECSICLGVFDADKDYIYKISPDNGYVCYACAEETDEERARIINKKIDYLKRSKKITLKQNEFV